jgi:hypothetical protein
MARYRSQPSSPTGIRRRETAIRSLLDGTARVVSTQWHGWSFSERLPAESLRRFFIGTMSPGSKSSSRVVHGASMATGRFSGSSQRPTAFAWRTYLIQCSQCTPRSWSRCHTKSPLSMKMLPRQPLRFLLADDPCAGKTIMAGLLIKELIARGDVKRCLSVCPGSLVEQCRTSSRANSNCLSRSSPTTSLSPRGPATGF